MRRNFYQTSRLFYVADGTLMRFVWLTKSEISFLNTSRTSKDENKRFDLSFSVCVCKYCVFKTGIKAEDLKTE